MTKRYYYDCAIEVAYMAKHFGMKFCSSEDVHDENDDPLDFIDDVFGEVFDYRKYIAPESLSLLEPKVEDWVITEWGSEDPRVIIPDHKDHWVFDEEFTPRFFKLIQRDGKPFIWPKVEEETA